MIGWKHKHGRAADIAVYAPLVLLPFVWFATTACLDAMDKLANPPPDATYGGVPVNNYPDQTRFGSGDQELACTAKGNYIGGGGANDEATRANIQASIERNKRAISETESDYNACKGKHKDLDRIKAELGCDESRQRELARQNSVLAGRGERNPAIEDELSALGSKCSRAEQEYGYGQCQQRRQESRQGDIARLRASLAKDESNLAQLTACINDKKRREDAARRPQIDPNAVLGIIQGVGRRPPSSGGHGGSSGHQGNQKH